MVADDGEIPSGWDDFTSAADALRHVDAVHCLFDTDAQAQANSDGRQGIFHRKDTGHPEIHLAHDALIVEPVFHPVGMVNDVKGVEIGV